MQFNPRVVDLFCGAGGLSLGCTRAGFSIVASYEKWKPAAATYLNNIADHVYHAEISENLSLPECDVIVGGPPCQGFSSAGLRRHEDERNTLVRSFAELVAKHRPTAFLFENVEGFLTSADGRFVFDLLEPVIDAGYRVHLRKVNAANYGVPQHRKRVIALGGLGWDPTFPEATHSAFGAPGAHLAGQHLPSTPTIQESIAGLPSAVQREQPTFVDGHFFTPFKTEDLERAKHLSPGQRMRDLPESLWHESYRRRAFRRVKDGTPTERRGGAPAGLRRLRFDEPSKAITGGALNEFIHPSEDRPLTLRECARLQTFPDDFRFFGTLREAIQQIGNAVPPRLAEVFARRLYLDLSQERQQHDTGALISFVPTLSAGMSPALLAVTEKTDLRFRRNNQKSQMQLEWL